MLINGEKWACETCIKGHRATHCKHTDRKLISIKKKGRPSTQCKRCRELRIVRQLHVKCDCENPSLRGTKKNNSPNTTALPIVPKKKKKLESLRPLAPKKDLTTNTLSLSPSSSSCCITSSPSIKVTSSLSSNTPPPSLVDGYTPNKLSSPLAGYTPNDLPPPLVDYTPNELPPPLVGGCCSNASNQLQPILTGGCCNNMSNQLPPPPLISDYASNTSNPLRIQEPNIPPPSSCCGPPSKNQQGEMIRVVTCRCGDDCACIGCDAHPSRAMKEGKNDVYIGFDTSNNLNRRRLSIAALTSSNLSDHPSSILTDDGVVLCGCGCSKTFDDCSNCFRDLCQGYLL